MGGYRGGTWLCLALVASGLTSAAAQEATPAPATAMAPAAAAAAPAAGPAAVPAAEAIQLGSSTLPAAGRHQTRVRVAAPGRYALIASSRSGTALTLIDRMAGPGPSGGMKGQQDGRLDVLLERGEYKLVSDGADRAKGEVKLEARPFRERREGPASMLVEGKLVGESLEDFEQISYWLLVAERRSVALEAAGRNLSDLRIWRDGSWLHDAEPKAARLVPEVGRPLRALRITTTLEPGAYRITGYGGVAEPWPAENGAHPFHLRLGFESAAVAGRSRRVMSPLGIDRILVPARANVFRIETAKADDGDARIAAGDWDEQAPFAMAAESAEINKKSVPPVASLRLGDGADGGRRMITVTLPAGVAYVLQHLDSRAVYTFNGSGPHWVSTVHTGHAEDSIDATAIVVRSGRGRGEQPATRIEPFAAAGIELDGKAIWRRRFNLLDTLTLHLHVTAAGSYQIVSRGTSARFTIEPFLITRPKELEGATLEVGERTWDLATGWYVLSVMPDKAGIADLELRPASLMAALAAPGEQAAARPSVQFPSLALDWDRSYTIHLNRQPEVDAGAVVRPLPLDLGEPLPLALRPGESVELEFSAPEAGKLRAGTEDGGSFEIALDGGAFGRAPLVATGRHRATVRNGGDRTAVASLAFVGESRDPERPLPALPAGAERSLPDFPLLAAGAPRFLDLEREETRAFLVKAGESGLYELESTGLLATAGVVRTRLQPNLFRSEGGGSGRNFRIGSYLREGDYQLTVQPRGASAGHLGVALKRTRLEDGGELDLGVAARISLPAGDAVVYRFRIKKAGKYRIESLGLGRKFRCRLEDGEGWPLLPPGGNANITLDLEPGSYRLVLLPEAVESRRVTTVSRVRTPRKYQGHGPHALALAERAENVWTEPEDGAVRVPDVWSFELLAPAELGVSLTGEMQGRITRRLPEGTGVEVAYVPPLRGWKGRLEAGSYQLAADCVRRNNRVSYAIELRPTELVPGVERKVSAPVELAVSIGSDALIEIASSGDQDVRATLLDADGREIARSDDRADDWNFRIAVLARKGAHRLRVDPVAGTSAETTVALRLPKEVPGKPLELPESKQLKLRNAAGVWGFAGSSSLDGLLIATLVAEEAAGIAIERAIDGAWTTLAAEEGRSLRVAAPVRSVSAAELRVRVWRLGRPGMGARLGVALATDPARDESALAAGIELARVEGLTPATRVARVDLERPGLLGVSEAPRDLKVAARGDAALALAPGALVLAGQGPIWFVADGAKGRSGSLRARRERLGEARELALVLDGREAIIGVEPGTAQGLTLVEVESLAGQPGVSFASAFTADLAVAPRRGWTATMRMDAAAVRLWRADAGGGSLDARVRLRRFPVATAERVELGVRRGSISAGGAQALELPSGRKELRLLLSPGLAAFVRDGERIESAHAALEGSLDERTISEATRIEIVSTAAGAGLWQLSVLPAAGDARALGAEGRFSWEEIAASSGRRRLRVEYFGCAGGAKLALAGAAEDATFLRDDGRIEHGREFATPTGGWLLLSHAPGALVAWLGCPLKEVRAMWGEAGSEGGARDLDGAARVAKRMRIRTPAPAMLHARAPHAAVTRIERAGGGGEAAFHPTALALDAWLPAGESTLSVRALGGGEWVESGEMWLEPATALGEGLGPEVLLAPGGARFFSFRLAQAATVGLGVQSLSGHVECVLRAGDGARIGEGVVQMRSLEPGDYLLELRALGSGRPVRARPALAGLAIPATGPPEQVVRSYLGLAGKRLPGEGGFGRVSAPDPPWLARRYGPQEGSGEQGEAEADERSEADAWTGEPVPEEEGAEAEEEGE